MADANATGTGLHFDTYGNGDPIVLLHGGLGGSALMDPIIPGLSAARRVIAVDLRGHGHSPDVDGPFGWEAMAADVAALIAQLGLAHADVLGYSLGGRVALRLALTHPERVRRLVLVSSTYSRQGSFAEVLQGMAQLGPEMAPMIAQHAPFAKRYPECDWASLLGKTRDLAAGDYDWSGELATLRSPTMLVYADGDCVRPDHIVSFWKALGGGERDSGLDGSQRSASQLAILPGRSHHDVLMAPELTDMVNAFLSR